MLRILHSTDAAGRSWRIFYRFFIPSKSARACLLFLAVSFLLLMPKSSDASRIVCYFENWAQYRNSPPGNPPSCFPQNLSSIANKMTVLNYSFLLFNIDATVNPPVVTNDWFVHNSEWNDATLLQQAVALQSNNANLRILISLGGWNFNNPDPNASRYGPYTYQFFSQVCANSTGTNRAALIASIVRYCTDNHLHGVDIDWEYPGQSTRGGTANDYQNLITFVSLLRTALTAQGLYLSMAVPPFLPSDTLTGTYMGGTFPDGSSYSGGTVTAGDITSYFVWYGIVAKFCDWVNVMTYDMNGPWAATTGYNAPLSPSSVTSVESAANLWTSSMYANVNKANVVIGIPAYGHTFAGVKFPSPLTGFPNSQYAAGCSCTGPGPAGQYTQQPGSLAYFEIYNDLNPPSTFTGQAVDPNAGTAYAWNQSLGYWASFDTPSGIPGVASSVALKAQYILSQQLGGAMVYAISEDVYWMGAPILSTIYNTFYPGTNREVNHRQEAQ